jgi:ABC-type proline/glycine betaine transport system ATPase subunit
MIAPIRSGFRRIPLQPEEFTSLNEQMLRRRIGIFIQADRHIPHQTGTT